jgi:hypothetical protein
MKLNNEYLFIYLHTGLPFLLKVVFLDTKLCKNSAMCLQNIKEGTQMACDPI